MSPIKDPILTIRRVRNGFLLMPTPGAVDDDTMIAVGPMSLSDCVQAWADGRVPYTVEDGGPDPDFAEVEEWHHIDPATDVATPIPAIEPGATFPVQQRAEELTRAIDTILADQRVIGETGDVASPAPADEPLPQPAKPR